MPDVTRLAALMSAELKKGCWGDIDSAWFGEIAAEAAPGFTPDAASDDDAASLSLAGVLYRVLAQYEAEQAKRITAAQALLTAFADGCEEVDQEPDQDQWWDLHNAVAAALGTKAEGGGDASS
jgi:hypothetical protein